MDMEPGMPMEMDAETSEGEAEAGPTPSRLPWVVAIVVVVALLGAAAVFGLPLLNKYFTHQYYRQSYAPVELIDREVTGLPDQVHLDGIPWIATSESLCQSTSLQMIAAFYGLEQPRRFFDFLMGFTYGISEIPGESGFFPGGTDPEVGFRDAAPFFNHSARYYTTDDPQLYLQALRHYLSLGYPVRVGLDFTTLYALKKSPPISHSEILVGYDQAGFDYYEPVCMLAAPCEPGEQKPGGDGLHVADQVLLDAVAAQSSLFGYPWQYAFTIFEAGPAADDLRPIWLRNGLTTLGDTRYGPDQGVSVIESLADEVEKQGTKMDLTLARPGLELAAYLRQENARFLRDVFGTDEKPAQAADLYDQVAEKFQLVLDATVKPIADEETAVQVAAWLREAAAAERQIGNIFIELGQ